MSATGNQNAELPLSSYLWAFLSVGNKHQIPEMLGNVGWRRNRSDVYLGGESTLFDPLFAAITTNGSRLSVWSKLHIERTEWNSTMKDSLELQQLERD